MILPLNKLIKYDENIYELTCAAIRRAYQITVTGDEEIEQNNGKVVSTAVDQVLSRDLEFRIED